MIRRGFRRVGRPSLLGNKAQQSAPQPAPSSSAAAPQAVAPDPIIDQLRELADLKERGVLTDAEFTAQKERLLAS